MGEGEQDGEADKPVRVLPSRGLKELLQQVSGGREQVELEPEAEEALQEVADDFVDNVAAFSCQLARHRASNTLEPKDVLLHLSANCGIKLPGFPSHQPHLLSSSKRPSPTPKHNARAASARRTSLSHGLPDSEQPSQPDGSQQRR